jgi:arylsulfatase A
MSPQSKGLSNRQVVKYLDATPLAATVLCRRSPAGAEAMLEQSYARYRGRDYAPDLIAEQALRFIRENRTRPFFLYFPTTVPHLALQVPDDSLEEYEGEFDDKPYPGGRGYLPQRHPRAAYAAMITPLDRDIGRMMDAVRELGVDENTVFIFTSDNGPLYDGHGGTDTDFFNSAAGFKGRKGSLYEGGVRVPLIVRWKSHIAANAVSRRVTGFEDWLPTLLELSGAGDAAVKNIDGISFAPTLLGRAQPERPFLYREFPNYNGWQSIHAGDWKAVRKGLNPRPRAGQPNLALELYNLRDDSAEARNVAAQHPDIVTRLERLMREQHQPSAAFPFPALDALTSGGRANPPR